MFFDFSLLHDIILYASGSIVVGVLLTAFFVFLLFFLIRGFYPRCTFSVPSIIAGVVLSLLLAGEMIKLCGAVGLKMKCDDIVEWMDQNVVHSAEYLLPVEITREESIAMTDVLIEKYPIVSSFVGSGWFEGYDTSNICQAVGDSLNSFLNRFIWESIGWSLLYVVIAAAIVVLIIRHENNSRVSLSTSRANAAFGRHSEPTVSRRRPVSTRNRTPGF